MAHLVTNLSNRTSFQADDEETILHAALRNGHLYPYGCQSGACGACKSKLVSGKVQHQHRDPQVLSDKERAQGWCLSCQAVPTEDIEIEVKEIARVQEFEVRTLPTRVSNKVILADDVVQLFLSLPSTRVFEFMPGQYIKILLKDGRERSFSIANTPAAATKQGLELHIRVIPGGHYSPQVKNSLKVKDIVRIQGPFGTFFLRKEEPRPIIMIAGGTGFAPVKGLIEDAIESGIDQPVHLYWGARSNSDLYMNARAEQWAQQIPGFRYTAVLSALDDAQSWQGRTGFVDQAVHQDYEDLSACSVYAAGPPVMIQALKSTLSDRGLDDSFFYTDTFDYAAQSEP